jgi:hypothetical protein
MPKVKSPASPSGKTSLESSAPKTTPSDAFSEDLQGVFPAKMAHWNRQGEGGRTVVLCLVPKEQSRGASSTPNTSAWPNDASVCSLSQVLETGSIPPKYFLSGKACAGILRRAALRGKTLPPLLESALRLVVENMPDVETDE